MKYAPFIFILMAVSLTFFSTSCRKEDDDTMEPPTAEASQDFKFYTNGTLRDADSIVARHSGNEIVIDYFSSTIPPFAFTGRMTIPDTVEAGRNYSFGQNSELLFKTVDLPDGHSYRSTAGTYSVTSYNNSLKRIEINFYGTLKGYDQTMTETGQNLSVSNGHMVSFYSE